LKTGPAGRPAKVRNDVNRLFRDERAQGAGEYALIAALVAVVALGALFFFGQMFGASIERSAGTVGSASGSVQLS
jgi:Flp pilus assembly pilin Flp